MALYKRARITQVFSRYEGTFLIFHRNGNELGRLYYRPGSHSMRRFARVIHAWKQARRVKIYAHGPHHRFDVRK